MNIARYQLVTPSMRLEKYAILSHCRLTWLVEHKLRTIVNQLAHNYREINNEMSHFADLRPAQEERRPTNTEKETKENRAQTPHIQGKENPHTGKRNPTPREKKPHTQRNKNKTPPAPKQGKPPPHAENTTNPTPKKQDPPRKRSKRNPPRKQGPKTTRAEKQDPSPKPNREGEGGRKQAANRLLDKKRSHHMPQIGGRRKRLTRQEEGYAKTLSRCQNSQRAFCLKPYVSIWQRSCRCFLS